MVVVEPDVLYQLSGGKELGPVLIEQRGSRTEIAAADATQSGDQERDVADGVFAHERWRPPRLGHQGLADRSVDIGLPEETAQEPHALAMHDAIDVLALRFLVVDGPKGHAPMGAEQDLSRR